MASDRVYDAWHGMCFVLGDESHMICGLMQVYNVLKHINCNIEYNDHTRVSLGCSTVATPFLSE